MTMNANVYNVIWADDEYVTLKNDKNIRELFYNNRIEVLQYVPTSSALKVALENYKDRVDAVIIDGNFSKEDLDYVQPDDISGLVHTLSFIDLFNVRRDIPFFLYTGKKVFLQEFCKNGELDYFIRYNRLIQKGEVSILAKRIVEEVEKLRNVEFLVRKKYQPLLNIAKKVDEKCEGFLYQFLLDEAYDITCDRAIDMFTQLRMILERIHSLCIESLIIPPDLTQLNQFGYYFSYSTKNDYTGWTGYTNKSKKVHYIPTGDYMPFPVARSLSTLIEITQDGSHNKEDLKLYVSEYVNEAQTPFLFRSCLYLVMDVLRWYNEIDEKIDKGEVYPPFYTKDKF